MPEIARAFAHAEAGMSGRFSAGDAEWIVPQLCDWPQLQNRLRVQGNWLRTGGLMIVKSRSFDAAEFLDSPDAVAE